jgi:hypothetical protein
MPILGNGADGRAQMQYYCIGCPPLMGLFFTLLYVLTAFIGPQTIFGDLAEYHIQIVIAVITLVCSLPSIPGSALLRMPQPYAIVGLSAAVFFSLAFNGWISGGPIALMDFIPNAMAFFFVVLNCRKKGHLQMLVAVLLFCALFTIFQAWLALRSNDLESHYLLTMFDDAGGRIIRIRGLSFISDPNDLAQFLVGLIPCIFLFWNKGNTFRNVILVLVPCAALILGMYLTHSRGGMVALLAVAIVAGRRKIGVVPSIIAGAVLFIGLSAIGWSGGREVSAASGSDRMDAWGVGLGLIRMHPFFGVGFRRFTEFNDLTAHNTVVVCAAELGLIGFFFWMLFILPTVRDAVVGNTNPDHKKKIDEVSANMQFPSRMPPSRPASVMLGQDSFMHAELATAGGQRLPIHRTTLRNAATLTLEPKHQLHTAPPSGSYGFLEPEEDANKISNDEIRRMSGLMVISFAGFLTAGWFLSRAYVMTLYINAGIVEVIYRMARDRGIAPPILSFPRAIKLSILTCMAFLFLVYLILRADHFLPK